MGALKLDSVGRDYRELMVEVRDRMGSINAIIREPGQHSPRIVEEFCFLQLRMIAELVALACVVAHDDSAEGSLSKLRREYSADKIIRAMERFDEDFFPKAVEEAVNGAALEIGLLRQAGAITATGIRKLWIQSGEVLHWNTGKRRKAVEASPEQADVRAYQRQLFDLLSTHAISIAKGERLLLCMMESGEEKELAVIMYERHGDRSE